MKLTAITLAAILGVSKAFVPVQQAAFAPSSLYMAEEAVAEEATEEATEEAAEEVAAPEPAAPVAPPCQSREATLASPNCIEFGSIWDPLGLAELGSDETIAWFRHAEIKHGRVAMAAFVGWWAVGAGLRLPGELAHGTSFASIPSKGIEAWDAVPGIGKVQMLLFAGLIELHDELFFSRRGDHYLRGGTPGKVSLFGLLLMMPRVL